MTQVDPEYDEGEEQEEPEPQDSPASRRRLARLEEENRTLKLEGFARDAGLDPKSGVGGYFINGYKGEVTAEAVKAAIDAAQLVTPPPEEPPNEGPPQDGSHIPDDERRGTDERQLVAAGVTANADVPTGDPRDEAIREAEEHIARGGTTESAMGVAFDVIAEAGFKGDKRAQWEPGKEDPKRPDQGW